MKITIVTSIFPPDAGGPATYTCEICKRLADRGHSVKIVTTSGSAQPSSNVYVVSEKHTSRGNTFLKLFRFVSINFALLLCVLKVSRECDVIYAQNAAHLGFVSLVAARLLGKPFMLKFVGDVAWETASNRRLTDKNLESFLQSPEGGVAIKRLLRLQRFVLHRVNKIITPSYFLRDILVSYYGVVPEKVAMIYNSIDLSDYSGLTSVGRQKSSNAVVVVVGRLVRHKRIDGIIRAASEITTKYANIELVIVGDGPERENLERLCCELGIDGKVKFLGNVSYEEVIELVKGSDIFVLNSVYEGLPHVVIEAMACRIPVIATDIEGTREVVEDSKTGLLVEPDNDEELRGKIEKLTRDEGLRERLVQNAYQNLRQQFTWESTLSLLEREFEAVL